jgi:hypothetical protein
MDKKGEFGLGGIIMIFIAIIVGLTLIVPIFDTQTDLTTKRTVTNEPVSISAWRNNSADINITKPFTITNAPTGWKSEDCPLESVVYGNATNNYVLTTDYTFTASTGVFYSKNTSNVKAGGNATFVDYIYCADGYNKDGASRSIAGLIGLFAALALLAAILVGIKTEWF